MIKCFMKSLICGSFIATLAGCSSMEVVKSSELNGMKLQNDGETDIAHISVAGYGLYFLRFPVVTGNFEKMGSITFFSDDITVKQATKALMKKARKMGANTVVDMNSRITPGLGLLWFKRVEVSGNANR